MINIDELIKNVKDKIEALAFEPNPEHIKKINEARTLLASRKVEQWVKQHPYSVEEFKTEEDYKKIVEQIGIQALNELPDEVDFHIRYLVEWNSTVLTFMAQILNEIRDFKATFTAANEDKITEWASKHIKDIQKPSK